MSAIARWCLGHRLAVVLLWLAALVGAGTASAVQGSVYSHDYAVPGTESAAAADLLQESFPGRANSAGTVVFHSEQQSVRSPEVEQRMGDALERVAELPGVSEVRSPYQGPENQQISEDGHTGYASVSFDSTTSDLDKGEVGRVVETAKSAAGDGLQVELTGASFGGVDSSSSHLAEIIGVAAAAVVLLLVFGSLLATLLPLVTALVSVGIGAALIGLLGHLTTVADFAPMLGTLIGLGVGIDYALFILTRHRRGLRDGLSVQESAVRAVSTSGRAVVFAGVTVCIALLGMLVLRLSFLNGVAIAASLTVALTVLASITLLPALLGVIGTRVLGRRARRRLREDGPGKAALVTGFGARWSELVERRPQLLGAVAAAVMLVLALPTLSLHLGTSDQGNDPAGSTTEQGYHLLADGFGPGANGPLTVVSEIGGADEREAFDGLSQVLRDTPGVAQVSPAQFAEDGSAATLTLTPQTAPQSEETSDLVERLRTDVLPEATESSALEVHLGGLTAGYDDFASVILGKLPLFCGVVVALGSALLLLAFRSLAIPLKAAAMNIVAVTASFGVVVAVFQWGWGSGLLGLGGAGPIEPFLPVIMVSVLFGLSMDYQVFLLSRMYEEWRATGDNRRAVRVGLAETGRVINSAAVIMIAVFGAFVFSGDRIIAMFGVGLATAVALDAFVLRTLLVPALMHLLGGANWWLPGWLERRLPRWSIEPPEHEREPAPVATPLPTPRIPVAATVGAPAPALGVPGGLAAAQPPVSDSSASDGPG